MHPTLSLLKRAHAVTRKLSPHANKRIIIACFPKSASTFLRNVIGEITGYTTNEFCVAYERNEQDLYLPTLIDHAFTPVANHSPFFSMAYVDDSFAQLPPEEQLDMVIDLCMPWFISFYVSWYKVRQDNLLDTYWLTYEKLTDDKPAAVADICRFYGIETDRATIDKAIATIEGNKKKSNLNVGVKGRGKAQLTDVQKQKIIKMASYYKDVDFSLIGITR
jgi:hypothetical protein